MRLAVEYFKRGFRVHHGRLRTRLMSVRSLLHYLSYQIYDRGITLTPSYVRKSEVTRYLLDTYGSEKLDVIMSYSFGTYEVDNYLMLEFGSKLTDDEHLKRDLNLLSSYFRTRKTEENISVYLNKKTSLKGDVTVKPFAKFEFGRVKFKGANDLSYHDNYYTVGNAKELFVSHIFYDALADYAGIKRDNTWTFRKELDRETESKYIMLVLDGLIKPNTEIGKKVYNAYLKVIVNKTSNIIYEETFMRRMEEIDSLTENVINGGKQLKGVTDYSVIYEDSGEEITHVPIYASYYAWDYDYDCPLDDVNRLRGIGGEFTRKVQEDRLPYEVMVEGERVYMYPVEIEEPSVSNSSLLSYLNDEDSDWGSADKQEETVHDYRISASNLIPSGFAYIGDDDYIRVLNATDLELSGDVTKYMINMFPKLNYKAQQKSVEKYSILAGSEEDLELRVKTVMTENETMFIKQHLKYYNENTNNEQVVEGLLMLNNGMKVPKLYTLLSGETVVELTEDDLNSKRVGVYTEESDSIYVYKFLVMFNTETKNIVRITDSVTGLNRQGKMLHSLSLDMLGLDEDAEESLVHVVRKEVVDKIVEHNDSKDYFSQLVTKGLTVDV